MTINMANNPLFGRKWRITIFKSDGKKSVVVSDSDFEANSLRCTFRVETRLFHCPWWAELTIWNLVGDVQNEIMQDAQNIGASVEIEAGYQTGNFGRIFKGTIFQPLFERVNVTDNILTLTCIDGLGFYEGNVCNFAKDKGYSYYSVMKTMSERAKFPTPLGEITPSLSQKTSPRGKTFFGDFQTYMRDIAKDNNASWYIGGGKVNLTNIDDVYDHEPRKLTPTTGIIGTPQQITNGVSFRHLLDPSISVQSPPMIVQLDELIIRQQKIAPPAILAPIDVDLKCKVVGTTYTGDTRGNDWYVDVVGVNTAGNVSMMLHLEQK